MSVFAPSSERTLLAVWERALPLAAVPRADLMLDALFPQADGAPAHALPLGEREFRLLQLRRALFGRTAETVAACPACGARYDVALDLEEMLAAAPATPAARLMLTHGTMQIEVRPLTSTDLDAAAHADGDAAAFLLSRALVNVSGDDGAAGGALPADDARAAIAAALTAADPLAELSVALTCDECGSVWDALFDAGTFVWAEFDEWAQRTLRDVHALASAYGWSERAVLGMSPWRRAAYRTLAGV